MKRLIPLVLCLFALSGLVGCAPTMVTPPAPAAPPQAAEGAAPSATPSPEAVTPQPPDQVPAAVPTEDLIAEVTAAEPKDAFGGITAMPLVVKPGDKPLWAVISTGRRNFDLTPLPSHFIAIYTYDDAGWQQLARLDLDSADVAPDFVDVNYTQQVDLDPSRVFVEVAGGSGAHGGTYQLVSFDGSTLRLETAMQSPSPGMGSIQDVNGDGTPEVVLDESDPYIFCYACGARKVKYEVLRWDPEQAKLVDVALEPLPADQADSVSTTANHAVELAQAGLWKDAYAAITEAKTAAGEASTDTLNWDYGLIKLQAEALKTTLDTEWPLIQQVFYGDYAAAVDVMRAYDPEQIWTADSPLVTDPLVAPFVESLSTNLIESASQAVEAQPDLAAAWFIRGWGEYLADPESAQARADVAQAASLAPDDALYSGSVTALE